METDHRRSRFTLFIDVFNGLVLLYIISFVTVTALPIPRLLHNEISTNHLNDVDKLVVSSSVNTGNKVNDHEPNPDSYLYVKRAIYVRESQAFPAVTENEPYTSAVEDDEKATSQAIPYHKVVRYSPPPKGLDIGKTKDKRGLSKPAFGGLMAGMIVVSLWLACALAISRIILDSKPGGYLMFFYRACVYFFCCCLCLPDEPCSRRKREKRRKEERGQSIVLHEAGTVSASSSTRTEAIAEIEQDTPTRHETLSPLERMRQEIRQTRNQIIVDEIDQSASLRGHEVSLMPSVSDTNISGPSSRPSRSGSISPSASGSPSELPRPASISGRAQSTPPSYLNLYPVNHNRRAVSMSRESPQRLENETDAEAETGTEAGTGSGSSDGLLVGPRSGGGGGGGSGSSHLQTTSSTNAVPDLTETSVSARRLRKKMEKPPPYEEVEPGPPNY